MAIVKPKMDLMHKSISDASLSSCIFSANDGYDTDLFVNESVAEKYFCVLCQAISKDPLETSCGHIFCKTCYKEYEQTSKPPVPCPTCRAPIEMTFVSQRLSREINNLKVKCGNEDSQCDWKGSLSDVKKHVINDCPYTFMVCKYCNDTGNPYRRMNKKKHYKICGKFPIVCQLCQMVIPRENYDNHINIECENILISCPNKCGRQIKKGELELHVSKSCVNRDVKCLYYHYGCNKTLKNADVKQHLKDDIINHLELKISYLERLTKSKELISIAKNAKNKSVDMVICGLYVRQNKPYMGRPYYKHINKDKRFMIRWDMDTTSWILINEINNTVIACKVGNFSTPLCKNSEFCMDDMSFSDDDEEIIFLDKDGDEKEDNKNNDNNNNNNNIKSDRNWYVKRSNKMLYMEGYSQKEWDLEWKLIQSGKGPDKPIPKGIDEYKTACICGKYLIQTKNDNKQNKLVCHHCDHTIFYNLRYYKCPVGNASLSHLQGYDLCLICTKVLQDIQISGVKKNRKCICGEILVGKNAAFTYGHARAINCNECKKTFTDPVTILNCKKTTHQKHPNGYDVCLDCAKKPRKVGWPDFSGWLQ